MSTEQIEREKSVPKDRDPRPGGGVCPEHGGRDYYERLLSVAANTEKQYSNEAYLNPLLVLAFDGSHLDTDEGAVEYIAQGWLSHDDLHPNVRRVGAAMLWHWLKLEWEQRRELVEEAKAAADALRGDGNDESDADVIMAVTTEPAVERLTVTRVERRIIRQYRECDDQCRSEVRDAIHRGIHRQFRSVTPKPASEPEGKVAS